MKNYLILPASLLLLSGFAHASPAPLRLPTPDSAPVADSIGIEKKDGKRFILHRVDQGQTLYSIARRYGRSVADLKAANPNLGESMRYDQVVRIPIPAGALSRKEVKAIDKAIRKEEKQVDREAKINNSANAPAAARAKKAEDPARAGIHVVEPGQTLYSLAVRYGVPQADVRKWNNLSNDNVLIGQALIVSEKAYQDRIPTPAPAVAKSDAPERPAPARPAETKPASTSRSDSKPNRPAPRTPDEPVAENRRTETPVTPERTTTPTATPPPASTKPADVEVIELPRPGNDAPMPTRGRRVSSSGVAEMIEGADGSGKYLALHRTAPIGTLVQVRNEFNNQSLWVKVIGRLPDTGVNDKILVKLSAQAFAKLSPDDRRFRAEVSYIVR
ncbi:septal ring lytic transglycosylase RlpA family protein [Spirosoma utsteinense]|uniref:LysM repeat protein n=1 Tax=Spirosoma utsteinense TaxID=2585773 RepID=A0ABR6W4B7_9BACT|nr:LysM peptidoglycan-binding domain-containing protein [Spirosoma utsteinense]MBC3786696.1 LysM repeat protein [Spirosoma utsteinense]MBC3791059.1 LysM repeat protein [Spirosoma utsteinense]